MLLFPENIKHKCLESQITSSQEYWLDGTRHASSMGYYHAHSKPLLKTSLYSGDGDSRSAKCAAWQREGTWSGTDCTNKLHPICQHPKFEFDIITNLWSGSDKSDNVKTLRRVEQNDQQDDTVSPYVILIVCLLLLGLIMAITLLVMPRKLYNMATRNTIFHEPEGYKHINNV